jgi:hypothetical protein
VFKGTASEAAEKVALYQGTASEAAEKVALYQGTASAVPQVSCFCFAAFSR